MATGNPLKMKREHQRGFKEVTWQSEFLYLHTTDEIEDVMQFTGIKELC